MSVSIGDAVTMAVTEVAGYACWGVVGDETGFVHCQEWSWERPIPESDRRRIGEFLTIKVFHLTDQAQDFLPLDVTYGGRFKVDFAGSVRLLRPGPPAAGA